MSVASPCTGVCSYDPARGVCLGCGRTLDEIGGWSGMGDDLRREVAALARDRLMARPGVTPVAPAEAGAAPDEAGRSASWRCRPPPV